RRLSPPVIPALQRCGWAAPACCLSVPLHDMGWLPTAAHPWNVTASTAGLLQQLGIHPLPAFEWHLTLMRLPVALTTSLLILLGFLLLRQLVGTLIAALAALLWATDPFLIAFSRLLHVDALLTMFLLIALLALLVACFSRNGPRASPATLAGGASWRCYGTGPAHQNLGRYPAARRRAGVAGLGLAPA
ncbi:MAG: phospholipid carrier-dependent glycosyltransferase, partial [Chloroflexaceae bacterium]|nr:phospholipid carrier-dependent glycosyltransferase [Chloroflexaceae bacterium]